MFYDLFGLYDGGVVWFVKCYVELCMVVVVGVEVYVVEVCGGVYLVVEYGYVMVDGEVVWL